MDTFALPCIVRPKVVTQYIYTVCHMTPQYFFRLPKVLSYYELNPLQKEIVKIWDLPVGLTGKM